MEAPLPLPRPTARLLYRQVPVHSQSQMRKAVEPVHPRRGSGKAHLVYGFGIDEERPLKRGHLAGHAGLEGPSLAPASGGTDAP